jgi:hypothetical protein
MIKTEYLPVKKPSRDSKNCCERHSAEALRRYTTPGSGSYDESFATEIFAIQPQWKPNTNSKIDINESKRKLLEMAKNGEKRPSISSKNVDERCLAGILYRHTAPNKNYDAEFAAEIFALQPRWRSCRTIRNVQENMRMIMKIARSGGEDPKKSKDVDIKRLGAALRNYEKHHPEFTRKIRELRPDWYVYEDPTIPKKQKLLEMARSGKRKPRIWEASEKRYAAELSRYTYKQCLSYDLKFDIEIRKIRPDWFDTLTVAEAKRQELLKMARDGDDRPNAGSKNLHIRRLGEALKAYVSRNHEFAVEIRRLRPDWFGRAHDRVCKNKQKLLELAKSGSKRPTNKLGGAFITYTNKKVNLSCYDPEFYKEIYALRPDWFGKVAAKKQKLLEMAKNGEVKPNKSHALYNAIHSYAKKSDRRYDPEFDAKLRSIRPDWFKHK